MNLLRAIFSCLCSISSWVSRAKNSFCLLLYFPCTPTIFLSEKGASISPKKSFSAMQSESMKTIISPLAFFAPRFLAVAGPEFFSCSNFTPRNFLTISDVASLLPSSTTIVSKSLKDCFCSAERHSAIVFSACLHLSTPARMTNWKENAAGKTLEKSFFIAIVGTGALGTKKTFSIPNPAS